MKRIALLVHSLPGDDAIAILATLAGLLRSEWGGAWADTEVKTLAGAGADAVRQAVREAQPADYFFGYFLAPGSCKISDRPWPQLFALFGNEEISETELNPGCPWCTLIADAATAVNPAATWPNARDPKRVRDAFDRALTNAEQGLVKIYPTTESWTDCGFTAGLLQGVAEWAARNHGVLTLDQAARKADGATYEGGRRRRHFPLGLKQ